MTHPFIEGRKVLVRSGKNWTEHEVTRLYKHGRFTLNDRYGTVQWRAHRYGGEWHAKPTSTYTATAYLDNAENRKTMTDEMHREDIKNRALRVAAIIDDNRFALPEQLVLEVEAALAKHPELKARRS